ncbi:hypothetical protein Tco_0412555 [Tanacetum coccineum]
MMTFSESAVEKPTVETNEPKTARKENGAPIIEEWESDTNNISWKYIVDKNYAKHTSPEENRETGIQTDVSKVGNDFEMFNKVVRAILSNALSTMQKTDLSYDYENMIEDLCLWRKFPKEGKNYWKFKPPSVSQMCDKKNSVLFTDIECVVLSPDFKLTDESHVSLKVPREDNMYSVDLKNVVPQEVLTRITKEKDENKDKRLYRTRNGKDCERQSQIKAGKSIKSKSQQKSQLVKVKVNPGAKVKEI